MRFLQQVGNMAASQPGVSLGGPHGWYVVENAFFLRHLYIKFDQDRLGTNIGKEGSLKKEIYPFLCAVGMSTSLA
eukprot:COSAG06_NODE_20029_length_812_cov_1.659187_1_plen_75_part_00